MQAFGRDVAVAVAVKYRGERYALARRTEPRLAQHGAQLRTRRRAMDVVMGHVVSLHIRRSRRRRFGTVQYYRRCACSATKPALSAVCGRTMQGRPPVGGGRPLLWRPGGCYVKSVPGGVAKGSP